MEIWLIGGFSIWKAAPLCSIIDHDAGYNFDAPIASLNRMCIPSGPATKSRRREIEIALHRDLR